MLLSVFYRLPLSLAYGTAAAVCLLAPMPSVVSVLRCAMREFCGSRSLRLSWLLPHGILFSCRRGRTSAIAAHRNFFRLFFYSDFRSALLLPPPSSTLIAATGVLLILSFRPIAHGAAPFDAPRPVRLLHYGGRVEVFFYDYYFCGELNETAPTNAMISINQSINQSPCLVSSLSPSLVSLSGASLLARRRLISGHFCIFPVGSGIEHFFRNNAAVLRFLACLSGCVSVLVSHRSAWPRCSCRVRSGRCHRDVIGMSSVSAGCLLTFSVMSAVVLASSFPVRPSSSRLPAPLVVSGDGEPTRLLACLVMSLPAAKALAWPCFGCGAMPLSLVVPLLPSPSYCFE